MKPQFEQHGGRLLVRAPAKINVALLVAGKRPDGFHELETVMAKVDLYDELLFEGCRAGEGGLICRGRYAVPAGPDNLVCRARDLLAQAAGRPIDVRITLTKNIPVAAGLGGGSSDGAATLVGLDRFLGLGLDHARLAHLAGQLGSDVPFFLSGPISLCTGRGERIRPLEPVLPFEALLVFPAVSASTKKVYENYQHDPGAFRDLHERLDRCLAEKNIESLAQMCANMLEVSCYELHPELRELKSRLEGCTQRRWCLSGSGSAMYTIAAKGCAQMGQLQTAVRNVGCESILVGNNRW